MGAWLVTSYGEGAPEGVSLRIDICKVLRRPSHDGGVVLRQENAYDAGLGRVLVGGGGGDWQSAG